jgi:hypothetical protein
MAKKTKTMAATLKEAKKLLNKNKKPRTSTIDQTLATAGAGFKTQKKATKTRTMAETLKAASPAPAAPKTKKVAKKAAKKSTPKRGKKQAKGKGKKGK